jgi:hypothetical protein
MTDSAAVGRSDVGSLGGQADGHVEVLSTDAVPLRERYSYWREDVCTPARGF